MCAPLDRFSGEKVQLPKRLALAQRQSRPVERKGRVSKSGPNHQPSIDKVAGPVGEALIMTFIGLFAAVPAVIFYNVVIGRNRQVTDALRNFAGDVQTAILGGVPASAGEARSKRR